MENGKQFYISSAKFSIQERTTKHGKVYDVVFRIITPDGIERQKKLSGFATKALAKAKHSEFITEKCELVKNNPIKKINTQKAIPTVDELWQQYTVAIKTQARESSIINKKNLYENHIKEYLGDKKITKLTKEYMYRWQDALWSKPRLGNDEEYSYETLKHIRNTFNSFLNWAETRYSYPNNLKGIPLPKRQTKPREMQVWTREQFDHFLTFVSDPMHRALFATLFFTGRRVGEILALTPSDFTDNSISITKTISLSKESKTGYKITPPKNMSTGESIIPPALKKELANYEGQSPFFFGGEKPLCKMHILRNFHRYSEKANLPSIRLHDLRHSFVSMCIHLGANLTVVADLIGDTLTQVTKTYAHLYESDKHIVISKMT